MPFGTATNKLRKLLLFDYAKRCNEDICYRCKTRIETIEEFSIEHTIPWERAENPVETFFDIGGITFSHLYCNVAAAYKPTDKSIDAPIGSKWCTTCKQYKPIENFSKDLSRKSGLNDKCSPCVMKKLDSWRRDKGLRPKEVKFTRGSKYDVDKV